MTAGSMGWLGWRAELGSLKYFPESCGSFVASVRGFQRVGVPLLLVNDGRGSDVGAFGSLGLTREDDRWSFGICPAVRGEELGVCDL